MGRVGQVLFFGVGLGVREGVGGEICSLGEDEEPHGVISGGGEFSETVRKTRFILFPLACHENCSLLVWRWLLMGY